MTVQDARHTVLAPTDLDQRPVLAQFFRALGGRRRLPDRHTNYRVADPRVVELVRLPRTRAAEDTAGIAERARIGSQTNTAPRSSP